MRILIDIGHPAHVHYFKHFIREMQQLGHEFLIVARDKEITFDLLEKYGIPYVNRGKGGSSLPGKLLYILKADWFILRQARRFKPDLFMSFASTYAAHASKLYRKPHIALDDTEHAKFELFLYPPFTNVIMTPFCFQKDLGKKQLRLQSYIEFSYLHKNRFKPDPTIKQQLGLQPEDKFVLFRYISWGASHDIGQSGIPDQLKKELIRLFIDRSFHVFISAEGALDPFFQPYQIRIAPEKIHDVIDAADFFVGESGTMSTEACILGTPAVFINSLNAGVFEDEARRGLLYSFRSPDGLMERMHQLLAQEDLQEEHAQKSEQLHRDSIDLTGFLVWFVEQYPESVRTMKRQPDYQQRFLPKQ
jgi:uncharacterized protein